VTVNHLLNYIYPDFIFSFFIIRGRPLQSVPITTKVVSANPVHGEVYSGFLQQ